MNNEEERRLAKDLMILEELFRKAPADPAGPRISYVTPDESESDEMKLTPAERRFMKAHKQALSFEMLKKGIMNSGNDPFLNQISDLKAKFKRARKFKENLLKSAFKMLEEGIVIGWQIEEGSAPYSQNDLDFFCKQILNYYENGSRKQKEIELLIKMIRTENRKINEKLKFQDQRLKAALFKHGAMLVRSKTTSKKQKEFLKKIAKKGIPSFIKLH